VNTASLSLPIQPLDATDASQQLLHALQLAVQERDVALQERDQELLALRGELRVMTVERDLLKEQLKAFERKFFAARSEARRDCKQADLVLNEAEALAPTAATVAVQEPVLPTSPEACSHQHAKRGRKPLDPALPRTVVRHELSESERVCPHDGQVLVEMGSEVSEQLDIVPQRIRVIEHQRIKYACPCCDHSLKVASAPARVIPKGLFSEAALAWILTAKYQDALPLYRQAALLRRFGGDLSRNTLAASVIAIGQAVQPVINLMRDHLLESDVLYGDETGLQVLKEPNRAAQTKSFLWAQSNHSVPQVRLFHYSASRSAKQASELYAGSKPGAALISDGYAAYDSVAQQYGLVHLGCWAHARRYFVEAEQATPKEARAPTQPAAQFLGWIAKLYHAEERAKHWHALRRRRLRQRYSAAVLRSIEQLWRAYEPSVAPQSLLGKALQYLSRQWPKLVRFIDDGLHPIDNNAAENAIRPFVVGRKNWLFAATVRGAAASANLYSLIQTCIANGLNAYEYLHALLRALPLANTAEDYEALLPWRLLAHT
jgi:transposase